ncbi:MAG: UDP-N-acetylmuramoyl-L-alanyl-D-glutamate--2,6-diaminopimelate ligase [Clostridia bacterium]|nr:UDP-N-acetylmuramoyl-L-alanyl-D-glutamate--2,6-diaminopimelate ligase [Clostridia bacterium]
MLLEQLIDGLEILDYKGNMKTEVSGIAYDSRKVKMGTAFVCIEGFNVDGHEYIPAAVENGAKVLFVQKHVDVSDEITVIKVKNTRYALARISDVFYGHPSGRFTLVGITGTKGKTTTTFMIKSILDKANHKVGLVGTLGSRIGEEVLATERTTPESYDLQALFSDMVEKDVNSVIMEVSSQGLELHRVGGCDFDIGVFTNISQDHIGPKEHPDFEHYLNAKIKLFSMCKMGLVNIDSKYGEEVIKRAKCEVFTYGIDKDADIRATDIATNPDNVEFKVKTPWGEGNIKVNIPGKFTIYNSLAAIGVCLKMGIPLDIIASGLEKVSVPGRAEIVETGRNFTIMIDYAHTPDSLENILTTVKGYTPGRLVCLFGCGGDRDRSKRPVMGEISGKIADFTVITSDNPRTEEPVEIINDIEEGIKKTNAEYIKIVDRRQAISYAIENAQMNDIIVLAGKGHETYQIFKDKTIHFDEREVVREILDQSTTGK